jgi:hypothetical protein
MAAHVGNKYWQFRDKHGRDFKYTPEKLWAEAIEYFEWCELNPLKEDSVSFYQGQPTHEPITKMRAMTIIGFCLYADIDQFTFYNYRQNKDFIDITTRIENIIRDQKFTGAAADLLNANIIARDLGLVDKVEQTGTTKHEIIVPDAETKKEIDKLKEKFE